jgi:hypothetical protein
MRKLLVVLPGVVASAVLSVPGSFIGLIGTQGMHGTEPFFEILAFVAAVLVVVNLIAVGVGMVPVALVMGARPYRVALLGSGAGALISAALFTGSMRVPPLWNVSYRVCFVLPTVCAGVAILVRGESDPAI